MTLKFIHAADLHIDSPLKGLKAKSEIFAAKLRKATRDAFKSLVDYAINEDVAFVIVAGDIFDGGWDNTETWIWTREQFRRLEDARVPVFIVYGNHDKKNQSLRNLGMPGNVKLFSDKAPERVFFPDDFAGRTRCSGDERVALTGMSYAAAQCRENLAASYPSADPNAFNIGVLHTGLGGEGAEEYAPTDEATLLSKGYQYWALGHIHKRWTSDATACWIGYSGSLQGRHINESGAKGFYLVEVENGELARAPEFVSVDTIRWRRIEIDATNVETIEELNDVFASELSNALDEEDGRAIAARVVIFGRSPIYAEARKGLGKSDEYDPLLNALSAYSDRVWVESYDLSRLAPPVGEDFWRRGALRDVKADVEAIVERLRELARAGKKLSDFTGQGELAPVDELRKKLGALNAALKGERSGVGVDLDDPEQVARFYEQALDTIADAFLQSEEE